jgi:serine/threonine-protein kinase RsbW
MSTLEARRLTLHNKLAELDRLEPWIEDCADLGMSPDLSLAVQLCVEEAVANVIMHASTHNDRLDISVKLGRCKGQLVARIEDNGPEFDPTQAPSLTVASSLGEARVGKFGIHLMRSFADGMDYERRDGRNRLTLRFNQARAT